MSRLARAAVADAGGTGVAAAVSALRELLDELRMLLAALPAAVYTEPLSAVSGPVGGHVRHLLDHVSALLTSRADAALSYDTRVRGTAVERDPAAALREIGRLSAALALWPAPLEAPVAVASRLAADGRAVTGWSSCGRELAFVTSHTIHHQAMIAVLLERRQLAAPGERFGLAPSTPVRR